MEGPPGPPREGRPPASAPALRGRPPARRAPDGGGGGRLPRLLEASHHRRDAGAPPPAGGGIRPARADRRHVPGRSEEHTSELQSRLHLVCRLLLEKKKKR